MTTSWRSKSRRCPGRRDTFRRRGEREGIGRERCRREQTCVRLRSVQNDRCRTEVGRPCPPRRVPRGRPSWPLEIETLGETVERLVAIDDLAPVSLRDAVIQLRALFGGHARIEGF